MNTQCSIKLFETKRVRTACIGDYLGTICPQVEIRKITLLYHKNCHSGIFGVVL
jgi:hypothetical protein